MAVTASTELPDRYNRPGAPRVNAGAPRVAALDGLRGVAIAAVVAFHAGVFPGGFLGVDLFFVLSGFLITNLLLREQQQNEHVSLSEFWTRRARRLVPAVLVLVGVAQVWGHTRALPSELSVLNGQSMAAIVYASNWYNVLFDVGYWSVGPSHSPLNHLWSLGIEEQFYLLFPLLYVLWFRRKTQTSEAHAQKFALVSAVLACVSFAATALVFSLAGGNRAYFGTDTRIGAILLGCALAAAVFPSAMSKQNEMSQSGLAPESARRLSVVALVAVATILALWIVSTTSSPWLYRGGFAMHALASSAIILVVVFDRSSVATRLLSQRPLVWLGERSYSLYLWHWPLIVVMTPEVTGLQGAAHIAAVAVAILFATIVSYELVEHPIRYSRLRGMKLVGSLATPAVAIAASALLFQPAPPPQFGNDTLIRQGRQPGALRIMLVGDSWARNLGIAMAKVDSTHRVSIVNMGKGGCGIADAKRERTVQRGDKSTPADCLTWHLSWPATVKAVRPEVAILNVGNWDQALQDFDGTGEFVGACHPLFRERYSRQLDTAVAILGREGARVFIMTIYDNDGRAGSGPDCMNALLRETASRHAAGGVRVLDLYAELCANHICPTTLEGRPAYDATGHLAPLPQRRIATWVLNAVSVSTTAPEVRSDSARK